MKTCLKYALLALGLSLTAGISAHAQPISSVPKPTTAPEIDPSLAVSGLALLAGTLSVSRARLLKR